MKILWNNSAGGNFNSAANWAFASVPGPADIVAMTLSGTYTVSSHVSNTVLGFTTGAGAALAITGSSTFTAAKAPRPASMAATSSSPTVQRSWQAAPSTMSTKFF
jgi:hypothetical protein